MKPRTLALVLALAACGSPARPVLQESLGNETVRADEIFLDARTLLVDGPGATTPRALLAGYRGGRLTFDGTPLGLVDLDRREVVAVSETRRDSVRIRGDFPQEARLLLWVDRADLATVAIAETGLASGPDADFAVAGSPGVRLRPGVEIAVVKDGLGDRRVVTIATEGLLARGEVLSSTLGTLWIPGPEATWSDDDRWLGVSVTIRSAAADDAPIVAVTTSPVPVRALSEPVPGWVEVETVAPVIAHGFVQAKEVEEPYGGLIGSGRVRPYASPSHSILVPRGTCLYDAAGGALTGLAISDRNRTLLVLEDHWYSVEIDSAWGRFTVALHDLAPEGADYQFERCADPDQIRSIEDFASEDS